MNNTGREFMLNTRYENMKPSDQGKGLPQPPLQLGYNNKITVIDLPSPESFKTNPVDMMSLISNRSSVREYSGTPMTLTELSYLLWCTQGVKKTHDTQATIRTVPSAGARHAFETYLFVNNVDGLPSGLYRFLAIEHKLVELDLSDNLSEQIVKGCMKQHFIAQCSVLFLWTAVTSRMTWRYNERGYRYLHLDAGHVCQNLYLAAEASGSGVCAIGAYNDAEMNRILGIDGEEQFLIYAATVGKKI